MNDEFVASLAQVLPWKGAGEKRDWGVGCTPQSHHAVLDSGFMNRFRLPEPFGQSHQVVIDGAGRIGPAIQQPFNRLRVIDDPKDDEPV